MEESVGKHLMPGDRFRSQQNSDEQKKTLLGPGLIKEGDDVVVVTKPGILKFREARTFWIDARQKRYIPSKGDAVLGIVTMKAGDIFRVDIGGSEPASLSYLSFEGATKRNRPDVKVGDLVYGKLLAANKDIEPEFVCIDSYGRSSGMGVVRNGGFFFSSSINLVRRLLTPGSTLLQTLGSGFCYEVAIGMNGRIWVKAKTDIETIAMANAITASELMTDREIRVMCKKLSQAVSHIGMDEDR